MAERPVKDYDKFVLRLPEGMRDAIAERAKRNGRSMNSEVVQILQDAISGPNVGSVRLHMGENDYLEINPNQPKSVIEGLMKLTVMLQEHESNNNIDNKKPSE